MEQAYQRLSSLAGGGNIIVSSVDGITDWPRFEPRGGRHSAVPSSWAGHLGRFRGEFMGQSIRAVHVCGGLVGARMDPNTPELVYVICR